MLAGGHWTRLSQRLTLEDKLRVFEMFGYSPHAGQLPIHASQKRFRYVANGRRFGKSTLASAEAIVHAFFGGHVTIGAPTYELAAIPWNMAANALMGSKLRKLVRGFKTAPGKEIISLRTGGLIDSKTTNNPKGILGVGRDKFIFEEAAQEADGEVLQQYIMPSLADHLGAVLAISTPRGMDWFYDEYELGQLNELDYVSWRAPSASNTAIPWLPAEIERQQRKMPRTIFEQEYLAVFLDAVGSVFRGYRDVATAEWQEGPIEGHRYVLGIDIAQFEDWTVIAVFDITAGCIAHLYRFNLIPYPEQEQLMLEASRIWNAPILIDATNNIAVAQHLEIACNWTLVQGFTFSAQSKAEVMNTLALAIQDRDIALLKDSQHTEEAQDLSRVALSELSSYRYQRTPAGNLTMSAPEGKHDDAVVAIALAYYMALSFAGVGLPPPLQREAASEAPALGGQYSQPQKTQAVKSRRAPPKLRKGR